MAVGLDSPEATEPKKLVAWRVPAEVVVFGLPASGFPWQAQGGDNLNPDLVPGVPSLFGPREL